MILAEKLLKTRYVVDPHSAHILVERSLCANCKESPCIYVCPAGCYHKEEDKLLFSYQSCMECGSCRIVCPSGAVNWNYPRGGFGVSYRFG
jgi:ferredoxin like protein